MGRARPLPIPGAVLIEAVSLADERGSFFELLRSDDLPGSGGCRPIVGQVNCSVSARGALRGIAVTGMPCGPAKVVACLAGEVLDVAVDLREGSPAFGAWHAERLGEERRAAIALPHGVGHAFMALADGTVMAYLLPSAYDSRGELRVSPLDPEIGIAWPGGISPVMSPKDAAAPRLREALAAGLLPGCPACLAAAAHEER